MKTHFKTLIFYVLLFAGVYASRKLFPVGSPRANLSVIALLAATLASVVLGVFSLLMVLDDKRSLIPSTVIHFVAALWLVGYIVAALF